jgi:hypothetical protein
VRTPATTLVGLRLVGRIRTPRAIALAVAVLVAAAVGVALLVSEQARRPAAPPTLADLWTGRASLVLAHRWSAAGLGQPEPYSGAQLEIAGRDWYLFNRVHPGATCAGRSIAQLGTQVRRSTDGGRSWSGPAPVVMPTPGTPWACAATDGSAVYDERGDRWRFLFQCLGDQPSWRGCYAERRGRDPMGPFTARPQPAIEPGALWRRICDAPGDDCTRLAGGTGKITDEGTFDIFRADAGRWWVGFHGYDGTRSYRGIARTRDFTHGGWEAGGAGGTPPDAVIDADDAKGWRENWLPRRGGGPAEPIGPGAGSIVREDGWYYQLAEVPDVALDCVAGQHWDLGLFRSRDLASSTWQQLPRGNPLVYSSDAPGPDGRSSMCNVLYPHLVRDENSGVTYVVHGRRSDDPEKDAIYVYRLAWEHDLLANGDFARGDAAGWETPSPATQRSVRRVPDESPDGTPYLAVNCGGQPCEGQTLRQDIRTDGSRGGEEVAFGGTFADAPLTVRLWQLDAGGKAVTHTDVAVPAGAGEHAVRATATIDDRARTLRYELYLQDAATVRADRLFVIPQDGCERPDYPSC